MELVLENLKNHNPIANRIEALQALAKLLLHEVESLAEISPLATGRPRETEINLTAEVQRYEADLICDALLAANGNQRKAAKMLGMKNSTLHSKIRRYELDSLNHFGQFTDDGNLSENN